MPEDRVVVVPVDALQSLLQEVQQLREEVKSLEARQDQDFERLAIDIAHDRQRIAKLEHKEPQPLQKDRAEILRALVAANGGKMLASDARKKMRLRKDTFSQMLKSCDSVTLKPYHLDKRQMVIILKSELV